MVKELLTRATLVVIAATIGAAVGFGWPYHQYLFSEDPVQHDKAFRVIMTETPDDMRQRTVGGAAGGAGLAVVGLVFRKMPATGRG